MLVVSQSPISHHRRKSGRTPLRPANSSPPFNTPNPTKPKPIDPTKKITELHSSNKENIPPNFTSPVKKEQASPIESFDASLAEELTAIREKLERLRREKERTEKVLKERGAKLDLQMQELFQRGVFQKQLEIEVDRLYRLKEIKLSCVSISPLKSLREKEQEKKIKQEQMKVEIHTENPDERKEEGGLNSELKTEK